MLVDPCFELSVFSTPCEAGGVHVCGNFGPILVLALLCNTTLFVLREGFIVVQLRGSTQYTQYVREQHIYTSLEASNCATHIRFHAWAEVVACSISFVISIFDVQMNLL